MTLEEMIGKLREVRDAAAAIKQRHKDELKRYTDAELALELRIGKALDEAGISSAKTPNGTAFFETKEMINTADADLLLNHAMVTGEFSLLVVKPRVASVKEYLGVHGKLPPGVSMSTERVVRVRKS